MDHQIGDFDLAFAYEAAARAHALLRNLDEMNKFMSLANEAGNVIKKTDDRKYFFSELGTIRIA
jgi:hypothetical protein